MDCKDCLFSEKSKIDGFVVCKLWSLDDIVLKQLNQSCEHFTPKKDKEH